MAYRSQVMSEPPNPNREDGEWLDEWRLEETGRRRVREGTEELNQRRLQEIGRREDGEGLGRGRGDGSKSESGSCSVAAADRV